MKVRLVASTENLLDVVYTAARTCYNPGSPVDMWEDKENISDEDKLKLVRGCIRSGHHSTLEHAYFTFAIEDVDRALTHQLVRHRLCSFSQQSQRYVKFEKGNFTPIVPAPIEKDEELFEVFNNCMDSISGIYQYFTDKGVKPEDARSVLPNACASNIVVSMNLRELMHTCGLRLCTRAQLPIRTLFKEIAKVVVEKEPWLKEYLVPKCDKLGYCDELQCCGRHRKLSHILKENELYSKYFNLLDLMEADVKGTSLEDVRKVLDELYMELEKVGGKK